MREQPTPCVNASRAQFLMGLHRTFNDDRVCDGCRILAARGSRPPRGDAAGSATSGPAASSASTLLDGADRGRSLDGTSPATSPVVTR